MPSRAPSFTTYSEQPLIGAMMKEGESDVTHYFTDDEDADEALAPDGIQRALNLAGAWQDMDWAEMARRSGPHPPREPTDTTA